MSAAGGKARCQPRGEIRREDTVLRGLQIVRRAVKVNDLGVRVEECEGSSPVPVAGLSDGARIDHVARGGFHLQGNGLGFAYGAIFGTEAVGARTVGEESALQVGVAEEGDGRCDGDERDQRVADRNHVGVFILGRAVHDLHVGKVVQRARALRQGAQPFKMFGRKLIPGPNGSGRGHGIEVVEFQQAGGGFVVITADKDFSQVARPLDHFVGRGAVADHVAEVRDKIEWWSCGEAGLQGLQVGVNVAKQQYSQ